MALAFADLFNQEARALEADGVDVIQFDEPAFNVFMDEVRPGASRRSSAPSTGSHARPPCTSATATASRPISTGRTRSATNGGNTRRSSRRSLQSRIDQVSLECIHSHVPLDLMALLAGKDVLVGVIDVATDTVETPEEVAGVSRADGVRAEGSHHRLHQLRHGADAPRGRRGQADRARRRRGAGAPALRLRPPAPGLLGYFLQPRSLLSFDLTLPLILSMLPLPPRLGCSARCRRGADVPQCRNFRPARPRRGRLGADRLRARVSSRRAPAGTGSAGSA